MSDKLTVKEFNKCMERGKVIDEEQLLDLVNNLYEENKRLHNEVLRLRTELSHNQEVVDNDWFKKEDVHLAWKRV